MTAIIKGLPTVCAIVNETFYCTTPKELEYENPERNVTLPAILGKLQWDTVFTSPSRNPSTPTIDTMYNNNKGKRKRIVPDGVYTIDKIMQIIYNSRVQTPQVTLQCPKKRSIKFTYEEFMKFLDFVYGFMTNAEEKKEKEEEEEKIK
ncbi:hypothetical protein ABEB36_014817 [Hypothenemus hampei]|uniref:Uncharacterized protein n=1 Tax=Hypothenemus hampei TaxID=57062 RepID=A0ABD1E195_HYPHA